MEHLQEINALVKGIDETEQYLSKVLDIGFTGQKWERGTCLDITTHENNRYTLNELRGVISEDAMTRCVDAFKSLLVSELHQVLKEQKQELSQYNITKQ